MVTTKELAEFQFDVSAAPISLGIKFENFCAFELDEHILVDDVDKLSDFNIYNDEIEDLPIEPVSLMLLANDLDPETRDLEQEKVQNLEQDDEFDDLRNQFIQRNDPEINSQKELDSIDFKIKHSEVKRELGDFKSVNKITTAFRLVALAIDKLSEDQRRKFDLENVDEDKNYFRGLALIDKSMSSIQFINRLGDRIMNQFIQQFPDRFKEFPKDDEHIIDWLNRKIRSNNQLDFIFTCAYISTKIKFANIEINDNPGFNLGIKLFHGFKCHQILRVMHLHTIDLRSSRFRNFKRFIREFSLQFGGSRLFYLEYLISISEKNYVFFESYEQNFSELDGKWKNGSFPYHDVDVLFKLSNLN